MGFIGSDAYYTLCAAVLAVLVLLLIGCQVKARRPPRKRPSSPPPQYQTSQSFTGMKFRLQYQIERPDGKIVASEIFTGAEKNIIPCLRMMNEHIVSQIKLYEKFSEKESEKTGPKPNKPRYAAGSDMDKINRNARMVDLEQESSRNPYRLIGIVIIIIFILLFFILVPGRA